MTKPKKKSQANPGGAGGFKNLSLQGAPKRSHHKRRDIPSDAPATPLLSRDGLPVLAFAIAPDPADPAEWQLPHHTVQVLKDVEGSVDWTLLETATALLSLQGDEGRRVSADPALIIDAARHIAGHYREASKPIPTALCVLI